MTVQLLHDARAFVPVLRARTRVTPTRLRVIGLSSAALVALAAITCAIAASQQHAATAAAWRSAEPLLVNAQTIDSTLSDADTTVAAAFLQGRVEPATLRDRYQKDMALASAGVVEVAREATSDPKATKPTETLGVGLPFYSALIQTAISAEAQGNYPLAASYLGEANDFLRAKLVRAARSLYEAERLRLVQDHDHSLNLPLDILALLLICTGLATLALAQRWLSRHFHRTLNVPILAASVLVLVVGVWFVVSMTVQSANVHSATAVGSSPLSSFTQAHVLALQVRADDELSLLTFDSVPQPGQRQVSTSDCRHRGNPCLDAYQADYGNASRALRRLLAASVGTVGAPDLVALRTARDDFAQYSATHSQIRSLDAHGDLSKAVALASGSAPTDLPSVSASLDKQLEAGIARSEQTFVGGIAAATGDMADVGWVAIGLSLLAIALILIGVQIRISEYR